MKSLVLGNNKAYLEEIETPKPHDEWVLVKIETTPICGSDRAAFTSETPVRDAGHEGSGVVVGVDKSTILKEGDRVVLNPLSGCGHCYLCESGDYIYCPDKPTFYSHFAEYVLIQDFVCTKLPDDIDFDMGSLACCALGPAFRSMKKLNVRAVDTVLITGLGPVGMGAVTIAKYMGAKVIAVENIPFRVNMAKELGADVVLDPMSPTIKEDIQAAKKGTRLIKAVDASGNGNAQRLCIDMMEPLGTVSFVGENHKMIEVGPSSDFIRKGLYVTGSWHYNLNDHDEMFDIIRNSPAAKKLITNTYGFSDVQAAFERYMDQDVCKVILKPWE